MFSSNRFYIAKSKFHAGHSPPPINQATPTHCHFDFLLHQSRGQVGSLYTPGPPHTSLHSPIPQCNGRATTPYPTHEITGKSVVSLDPEMVEFISNRPYPISSRTVFADLPERSFVILNHACSLLLWAKYLP